MSTSLPTRVQALRDRLITLDQMGSNVREAALLEDLRSELAASISEFRQALNQRKLLIDSGIAAAAPVRLNVARKRAASLLEKFKAQKTAAALKKGVGWTSLVNDISAASSEVIEIANKSWEAYRQEVFTGETPRIIKGRLALTSANTVTLKHYEQLHHEFCREFDRLPTDPAAIRRVRALSKELTETAQAFDYDVPMEVKRFLEAVQSGGATLDLLTDIVKSWLTSKDALVSYRIVPRGIDGGR